MRHFLAIGRDAMLAHALLVDNLARREAAVAAAAAETTLPAPEIPESPAITRQQRRAFERSQAKPSAAPRRP